MSPSKTGAHRLSRPGLCLCLLFSFFSPGKVLAQWDTVKVIPDSTMNNVVEAGEAAAQGPRRRLIKFNEFDGPVTSIRVGVGALFDLGGYIQDKASKEQINNTGGFKLRDFRFVIRGKLKTKRPITWSTGIMYDGVTNTWLFRETGFMIAVPEAWGNFFIGRTKEGFSMNKVMVGYSGWTIERSTMNDATVPILGDGIKWLGHLPNYKVLWNLGYYFDKFNANQSFSSYVTQVVARVMWLPIMDEKEHKLLHIGGNFRYGRVDGDTLQLKSRPESITAPYFVDTRPFPCKFTTMAGWEIYYRNGPWMLGTEYWFQKDNAPNVGNPLFSGGDIAATWLVTGETRSYNKVGGYFNSVSPASSLFKKEGGNGGLELVLRFSYVNLDGGSIKGGKLWRITPTANLFFSDNVRLSFVTGYGQLYKYDLVGGNYFFQFRLQLTL